MRRKRIFAIPFVMAILLVTVMVTLAGAADKHTITSNVVGPVPDTCSVWTNFGNTGNHNYPDSGMFQARRAQTPNIDGSYTIKVTMTLGYITTGTAAKVYWQTPVVAHGFSGVCEEHYVRSVVAGNKFGGMMRFSFAFRWFPPAAGDFSHDLVNIVVKINGLNQNGMVSHDWDPLREVVAIPI